jgi:cysteine desulfurase
MATESARLSALRDRLYARLTAAVPGVGLNGTMSDRLPHNLSVHFTGVEGEAILMAVDDIALSSGSACSSGTIEPSYVLKACGVRDELALASIRVGLGRFTTEEEVDYAADKIAKVIEHLRSTRAAVQRGRRSSRPETKAARIAH